MEEQARWAVLAALEAGGLGESDTEYKKDIVEDRNLSPLVQGLLNRPLDALPLMTAVAAAGAEPLWAAPLPSERRFEFKADPRLPERLHGTLRRFIGRMGSVRETAEHALSGRHLPAAGQALRAWGALHLDWDADALLVRRWGRHSGDERAMRTMLNGLDRLAWGEPELAALILEGGWRLDPLQLHETGRQALAAVAAFVEEMEHQPDRDVSFGLLTLETPWGRVAVGDGGRQRYPAGASWLVIDLGGDDVHSAAGVAAGPAAAPLVISVDLGGNDRYAAAGTGLWGLGLAWDEKGDDTYEAKEASLGCGVFGGGYLIDRAGNDRYTATAMTQAAAAFGVGVLFDGAGNDRFKAGFAAQAFAGVNGLALLVDQSGDDLYEAGGLIPDASRFPDRFLSMSQGFSSGLRPFAPGGLAILWDGAGDDRYVADVFGQGGAYWYGCGILADCRGADRYVGTQYVQGSGVHLAAGLLYDGGGDDHYLAAISHAQGGAHDFAVGALWDVAGHDRYDAHARSQGSAFYNAVALLIDGEGNDRYSLESSELENGQGAGFFVPQRGVGGIGLLADGGGRNAASHAHAGGTRVARDRGVFSDHSLPDRAQSANPRARPFWRGDRPEPWGNTGWWGRRWGHFRSGRLALEPASDEQIIAAGGDPALRNLAYRLGRLGRADWKRNDQAAAMRELSALSEERLIGFVPWAARRDSGVGVSLHNTLGHRGIKARRAMRHAAASPWPEIRAMGLFWLSVAGEPHDRALFRANLNHPRTRPLALMGLARVAPEGGADRHTAAGLRWRRSDRGLERALAWDIAASQGVSSERWREWMGALSDADWNVRQRAVEALRQPVDPAIEVALRKRLARERNPVQRYWIERALQVREQGNK